MEKDVNEFAGLIAMIKKATTGEAVEIAVQEFAGKFFYGEIMNEFISKPFELDLVDKDNICQQLYDCLVNEFGEQLGTGYSHSIVGSYKYFITLNGNVKISFPDGFEYDDWIYNQVQKDMEKQFTIQNKTL